VIDGPFPETKELIGGFWLWQVKSMDEAVDGSSARRFMGAEVEIRQVYEASDFPAEIFSPKTPRARRSCATGCKEKPRSGSRAHLGMEIDCIEMSISETVVRRVVERSSQPFRRVRQDTAGVHNSKMRRRKHEIPEHL